MKLPRVFFLVFFCMVLSSSGHAQDTGINFKEVAAQANTAAAPQGVPASAGNEAATAEALKKYYAYLAWQHEFAQRSWNWHFFSTILMFCIVLAIVAFGLWMTYLQFNRDYGLQQVHRRRKEKGAAVAADGAGQQAAPAPPVGTMKISAAGMELSSQIIGLFVLGFSLAFFYLYVKEVYPVQVLNLSESASSPAVESKTPPTKP
jgi:hypothetical protein